MRWRVDQALALRGATLRSVRWPPALVAVALVGGLASWRHEMFEGGRASAVAMLRIVAVLLAMGAAFVLDDAAAASEAAAPTPLWWRRALRCAVVAAFVLPAWAALVMFARSRQDGLPWARPTLELAALVMIGLAVGAAAIRWRDADEPGMIAALAVLGGTLAIAQLPPRYALFVSPGSPHWGSSAVGWAALLVVATAVFAAATRDPATRLRRSPVTTTPTASSAVRTP